jgi:hypothetical protein
MMHICYYLNIFIQYFRPENKEFINFLKMGKPRSSKDLKSIYIKLIEKDRIDIEVQDSVC